MRSCLPLLLVLLIGTSCSRQPGTLIGSANAPAQPLSFVAHNSDTGGVSPTHALVDTTIPRGTEIVVRLQSALSSAGSHPGDAFSAVLDKPVAVKGEVLAPRGARVSGRVVSVHAANAGFPRAFLQLTLCSLEIAGRDVVLHSSAIFAKSVLTKANSAARSGITLANSDRTDPLPGKSREVEFSTGRKLTFWLVQASPL